MARYDSTVMKRLLPIVFVVCLLTSCRTASEGAPAATISPRLAVAQSDEARRISEATGRKWIVSTQGRAATSAVAAMYEKGGNIIDAAVAASFAISVERPQSTGLGGGGFLLYREGKTGKTYAVDFRERAPEAADEDMYLDKTGEIIKNKSLQGIYAGGVPGLVKGLVEIHRRFGTLDLHETVRPAIDLALAGLQVYPALDYALREKAEDLKRFPASRDIFLKADGRPYARGEKIVQKDLAESLKRIADTEGKDFYEGRIAGAIVEATRDPKNGNRPWITANDLKNYTVKFREPIDGRFHGYDVVSMPPPSSGGVHVIEMLNILEHFDLKAMRLQTADAVHRIASAMQMAFVDRARYMGDPDFVAVPVKTLTSKEYAAALAAKIAPDKVYTPEAISSSMTVLPEHTETTHFSIMDAEGNVVVSTQTVNGYFGSLMVIPGTGILLNNEMDDFSARPGASNMYGAIGSKANAVHAGKTPLSSMSPTIVLKDREPVLALGAPGGTRIINCVTQTIVNYLEFGLPLYEAVAAVRIHQQWKPEELFIEDPGLGSPVEEKLIQTGWKIKHGNAGCDVMAVAKEGIELHGVSEPRDFGQALGK
jgi:gamma-glutamyltranspeptidase / glutathione hydrolase